MGSVCAVNSHYVLVNDITSNNIRYSKIEYAFYVGLIGFAVTAVTWWWWAIFTIKYLITTLARASANLTNVDQEVADVKMELRKLKDEK